MTRRRFQDLLSWQGFAALLLALFIVGQGMQLAHFGKVAHRVCEDGEIAHAEAQPPSVATDLHEAKGDAAASSATAEAEDHHHCHWTVPSPQRSATAAPALAAFHASPEPAPIPTAAEPRSSAIPLFRLAPKGSPPAKA